ncbi:MAG: DUF413 domain-containing protein [Succinivibrionaceae bacterium]|nr:DUF413 domain-containing protein [Succinivibrionaceae bacterium]
MSFESDKAFNDFNHFPRGIRRSGEFSIREADLLEQCGSAMMDLKNGVRKPKDEAERTFVAQINGKGIITDSNAKIFSKYLAVIKPRRQHRLGAGGSDDGGSSFMGGGSSGEESSLD